MAATSLLAMLRRRGLVAGVTSPKLEARAESGPLTLYCGFDPTASSLHIGNLLGVVTMLHFMARGHRAIALVGGATGLIGDPSGRSTERPQQAAETVAGNAASIETQLRGILGRGLKLAAGGKTLDSDSIRFVNNAEFYQNQSVLTFVGQVGRHMRVSSMLGKDSVRSRLDSEGGMSYAEFSYQLFQAYDYFRLFQDLQCTLQIGGSDQWGNITAGIDLIQKLAPDAKETPHGLTLPLLTDANGQKLGKSAGNALWLAPTLTSPFSFYQFFVRLDDDQAERLLRLYTFMPVDEVDDVVQRHRAAPHLRLAQKSLAEQVLRLVHGDNAIVDAQAQTAKLYGGAASPDAPPSAVSLTLTRSQAELSSIADLAVAAKLCGSKGEAKRLATAGGLYVNKRAVDDAMQKLTADDLQRSVIELRKGKKDYAHVAIARP